MQYADPYLEIVPTFTEGAELRVVDSAAKLQALQQREGNWQADQGQYAGQVCKVEVGYPNGDVACSFADGRWIRFAKGCVELADPSAAPTKPAPAPAPAPAPPAVPPPGVPAAFAPRFTEAVAPKPAPPIPEPAAAPAAAPGAPPAAPQQFRLGDRVRVRDYDNHSWRDAQVTSFTADGTPKCMVDGHRRDFVWKMVEWVAPAVPEGIAAAEERLAEAERMRDDLKAQLAAATREHQRVHRVLEARRKAASGSAAAALAACAALAVQLGGWRRGDRVRVMVDAALLKRFCEQSAAGWEAAQGDCAGKEGTILAVNQDAETAHVEVPDVGKWSFPFEALATPAAAAAAPGAAGEDEKYVVPADPVDSEVVAEVEEVWKKCKHGSRRKGVDKWLELVGANPQEPLEFWDLREQGSGFGEEKLACGEGQMILELFYFGELKDCGADEAFRGKVEKRLAECGLPGVKCDKPLRDAGCMYALVACPAVMTRQQAAQLGHLVFEDFGKEQAAGGGHPGDSEGAGGGDKQQQPGCAPQ